MSGDRGIYHKFVVTRTDGRSAPGEKHADCFCFVLDAYHDPHALPALKAYADACEPTHPMLAADLRTLIAAMEQQDWGNRCAGSGLAPEEVRGNGDIDNGA
jgi:hypothetical protein